MNQEFLNNKLFYNLPLTFDEMVKEKVSGKEVETGGIVHEDGSVTFRIYAPDIDTVTMKISVSNKQSYNFAFEKKEDGFFELFIDNSDGHFNGSLTLNLLFNGVRLLYPYLPVHWSQNKPVNYFEFPCEGHDYAALKDVPHGAVTHQVYYSTARKQYERCLVYTPPGYMTNQESYPVLYLQHGGGEDETVWESTGHISFILDNLLSEKECVPFIVVMNNNVRHYPDTPEGKIDHCFEDTLINDCIPFIESHFRVKSGKDNRAICGLSFGSYITNDIALFHPDMFSYVGALTGSMYHGEEEMAIYERPYHKLMETGNVIKNNYKVYWQSATPEEDWISYVYEDNRICKENGIADMEGYHFVIHPPKTNKWTSWRMGIRDFARLLFR
mgnify:FL=1